MQRLVSLICLMLLLGACASGGLKERDKLRNFVSSGNPAGALELLASDKTFQEEKNKLLLHLEKGSVFFESGDFDQSIAEFEIAKEVAAKLYTVSVSKKIAKTFTNDNSDNYYGEAYERSTIHFYLALAHFTKYQLNADKESLYRARAELLAWDSMLTTLQNDRLGESVFKNDLLAKVFGAMVHEAIGTRNDLGTAFILYNDALTILFRNYNSYPTYNERFSKFQSDFEKLPKLSSEKVREVYVSPTPESQRLSDFLTYKVHYLAKTIRPNEYQKYRKIHPPSDASEKMLAEALKSQTGALFVVREGLIPKKVPEEIYFGLEKALSGQSGSGAQAAATVGAAALTVFAAKVLGLTPPAGAGNIGGAYFGIKSAELAATTAAISFELPKIESTPAPAQMLLRIYNAEGAQVSERALAVASPYGDIAQEAVREHSGAVLMRTGTRVALKHAAAIVAAYGTYRALKGNNGDNDFLARSAALLGYVAASKGIAASERADTRYWSLVPANIRLSEAALAPGKYSYEILAQKEGQWQSRSKGSFEVGAVGKKYVPVRLF